MNIDSKLQMYRELHKGRFGNYPRNWSALADVLASGYRGEVSIRSRQTMNPVRLYHVPVDELAERIAALPVSQSGAGLEFSEAPDDTYRGIQGEWNGAWLIYSRDPQPMRFALAAAPLYAEFAAARMLLRRELSPGDYDWLCELEREFPNHTVEFTVFHKPLGLQAEGGRGDRTGSQMIVWEVRRY